MEGYGKRVLIVDDDHHARFYMGSILEREGYTVPACNGMTALNELSRRHFDVVIMDDQMPYLSATEFLAQVQTRHSHVPVILASARGEAAHAPAENRQPFASIPKPYDASRLLAAVRSAARAIDAAGSDSLAALQ